MEGNFKQNLSTYLATYLFIGLFIVISTYLIAVFFHHVLHHYVYGFLSKSASFDTRIRNSCHAQRKPKPSPLLRNGETYEENSIARENPERFQGGGKTHSSEQVLLHGNPNIGFKRVFK